MARYRILIADPLLAHRPQWPPGCALVERGEPGTAGTHWWTFEDPEAPGDLEGRQVEIRLERDPASDPDGPPVPRIASRRLIVTHLYPADDSGEMPCCGVPAWEKPGADGITDDKEAVTCGGGEAP
jgi:hypothetical protein